MDQDSTSDKKSNFLRTIIAEDVAADRHGGQVVTRFPPEPNGYLHIGSAKAVCINFMLAAEFGGRCHLRFDDTNPVREEQEFIDSIREDIRWLGFDWGTHEYYASDYFEQLYAWAIELIRAGKAYVDDLSAEQIREYRGTLTEPGRNSPYRDRPIEENLALFEQMRSGTFPDGARVLRARIDMAAGNMNLRDPVMYRIVHARHPRTGTQWCIYPTYDYAHGQSDSIERITHSMCSLEFEDHRPLYDWFIEQLGIFPSRQYEFARLNITYLTTSKRYLRQLVEAGQVSGWDDPRLPTLRGMRRRGYSPAAIRNFIERVGVARANSTAEFAMLEHCVREDLNRQAPRAMAVLRPLKLVIENYPEHEIERLDARNHPDDPDAGTRQVPFSRELYIEQDDFLEDPPKKFFRLAPGREVRLRYAYLVTCREVVKDAEGNIVELRCSYDPDTRGGNAPDGRKVKATLHWVCAQSAIDAEVRLYDHLFTAENPLAAGDDWQAGLNSESLTVLEHCKLEPGLAARPAGHICQLERLGYFCIDPDSRPARPVLNRTVGLRDSWARVKPNDG